MEHDESLEQWKLVEVSGNRNREAESTASATHYHGSLPPFCGCFSPFFPCLLLFLTCPYKACSTPPQPVSHYHCCCSPTLSTIALPPSRRGRRRVVDRVSPHCFPLFHFLSQKEEWSQLLGCSRDATGILSSPWPFPALKPSGSSRSNIGQQLFHLNPFKDCGWEQVAFGTLLQMPEDL